MKNLAELLDEVKQTLNSELHKENKVLKEAIIEYNKNDRPAPKVAKGASVVTSLGVVTCYSDTGNNLLQEKINNFLNSISNL